MIATLRKLMTSATTPEPTISTPEKLRELCTWFNGIEAEEKQYFAKIAKCHSGAIEVDHEIADLQAELRNNPDPKKFRRLAEVRILARELRQLETESVHQFFWQRRDFLTRREALYHDHREKLSELVEAAENLIRDSLKASQARDSRLSEEIGSREPIISKETRRLLLIQESADKVKAGLHECTRLDGSDRTELYWQPATGLVAQIQEEIK